MINPNNLYQYTTSVPLTTGSQGATPFGTLLLTYEVKQYNDMSNLNSKLAYKILCTQRIIIPNGTPYEPGSQDNTAFDDYPAIVTSSIHMNQNVGQLISNYSPRTINSSVSTSISNGSGTDNSTSYQHTSGSTISQSNSFGGSASIGFFGNLPTGGISAEYSHGWGSDKSRSNSTGGGSGSNSSNSISDTMSIKDWGCSAALDVDNASITWTWGQEYPWNIIQFRNNGGSQSNNIVLPSFIVPLLADNTQTLPPSQLSLFGVDFTMAACWIVEPDDISTIINTTQMVHDIEYYTASHSSTPSGSGQSRAVTASISAPQKFTYTSPAIDLCTYGLDPITGGGALIGFIPKKFIVFPAQAPSSGTAPTKFKIISSSNNLMIDDTTSYSTTVDTGAGFAASLTALTGYFTQNCTSLQVTVSFKVIDALSDYTLYMKHWKTNTTGVQLTMVINGDQNNVITKFVDALESEGGENNLLSIDLRNQNYGSVDYHDFLQFGLNTIQITITPMGGKYQSCGYQIRTIAIERS